MSAANLAECWAKLKGEHDPFAIVWNEQATAKDRRFLLVMAGEPPQAAGLRAGYAWLDLKPELRAEVKRKLAQFAAWAERLK